MRILLTNDDGIHAKGLSVLEEVAAQISDDVWVVAPETDQSGLAHSLTLNEPLRLRKAGEKRFALKGTPTDCVIMAVRELMDEPPDLLLSGINSGQNIGDDVTYSGTIAAAMEGTLLGIPSIALSQAFNWAEVRKVPWETGASHAVSLIKNIVAMKFPEKTFINVNFPNCDSDEVAGVQITRQGAYTHGLFMEERQDGRGFPYYWLRFGREVPAQKIGTDIEALADKRISVTPLNMDLTHEAYRQELAKGLNAHIDGHSDE